MKIEQRTMTTRERFQQAEESALEQLDGVIEALICTVGAHIAYKERHGYSVSEEQAWKQELSGSHCIDTCPL